MPMITARLTPGAFDAAAKAALARGLTAAACKAEGMADTPKAWSQALVMFQELASGTFFVAAEPAERRVRGVFVTYELSAGIIDAARKAAFAAEVQAAAETAAAPGDGRRVVTSAVIQEVPEGQWAQMGSIWRLPEIAAAAQFAHLAPIAQQAHHGTVRPSRSR